MCAKKMGFVWAENAKNGICSPLILHYLQKNKKIIIQIPYVHTSFEVENTLIWNVVPLFHPEKKNKNNEGKIIDYYP